MLIRTLNTLMTTICIFATVGAFFVIGCDSDDSASNNTLTPDKTEVPVDPDPPDPVQPDPDPDPPDPVPVDGKLEVGSRVKVTNTIVDGVDKRLHIRNPAGIESDIIGSAADGATGTIVDGPALGDGWTWFQVLWDDNGKVAFGAGHECCTGWSAETDRDNVFRYLTEIE